MKGDLLLAFSCLVADITYFVYCIIYLLKCIVGYTTIFLQDFLTIYIRYENILYFVKQYTLNKYIQTS